MKAAGLKELKQELKHRSSQELLEIILRLSRFKKENKELLTYLLFESANEDTYVAVIKAELDEQFEDINSSNYYFIKKSIRKILRRLKQYIRYSSKKETEVELLIYFCFKLRSFTPSIHQNKTLQNLYERQLAMIKKKLQMLHEDLQYDLSAEMERLGL